MTIPSAKHCPACGTDQIQAFCFTVNGCGIWRCIACGLGRTEAPSFQPDSYYTAEYFSGGRSDGYADYVGSEAVLRREFAKTVAFIRQFQPSGRLLDVGCAYGFFLKEAQPYFDVSGIEPAEDAVEYCRRSGLRVFSGMADAANLSKAGEVDAVTLFDVIEHLPQPRDTLAACVSQITSGGLILITTGDFGSLAARVMGRGWRLMTPPQHLWFFTTESMRRLAAQLGLSVLRIDHPRKVVPLSLIGFQLRRMLDGKPAPPTTSVSNIGVPVNLLDAMRVVLRKGQA